MPHEARVNRLAHDLDLGRCQDGWQIELSRDGANVGLDCPDVQ
jgi:hypothetical protein